MLGYNTDQRDYFKGDLIEFYLKKAVSFSGGNQSQYEYFKSLMTYSIYNITTNNYLHDSRAAQFSLFLFPFKLKILLAINNYQYEQNLIKEFNNYNLHTDNILMPITQLRLSNLITNNSININIEHLLNEVVNTNFQLSNLLTYLNIQSETINLNSSFLNNANDLLDTFNINNSEKERYLTIIKNNDRREVIVLAAKALNYKNQSINYLMEAFIKWQQISST